MRSVLQVEVFVTVVQTGSFSAASAALGISPSYASKLVSRLEDRLGVRLLQRTTRTLTLTDLGVAYFAQCEVALGILDQAERSVGEAQVRLLGRLRVTMPTTLGLVCLTQTVAAFALANEGLSLELIYLDRHIDLIAEGIDVAIRVGDLPDSSLVARTLTTITRMLVASPAYLERAGTPTTPEQLRDHTCLRYSNQKRSTAWTLHRGKLTRSVSVDGALFANHGTAIAITAQAGLGIAYLPEFHVAELLASGALVRVLPEWGASVRVHAVYPSGQHIPAKVRAFVEHVQAHFREG